MSAEANRVEQGAASLSPRGRSRSAMTHRMTARGARTKSLEFRSYRTDISGKVLSQFDHFQPASRLSPLDQLPPRRWQERCRLRPLAKAARDPVGEQAQRRA